MPRKALVRSHETEAERQWCSAGAGAASWSLRRSDWLSRGAEAVSILITETQHLLLVATASSNWCSSGAAAVSALAAAHSRRGREPHDYGFRCVWTLPIGMCGAGCSAGFVHGFVGPAAAAVASAAALAGHGFRLLAVRLRLGV